MVEAEHTVVVIPGGTTVWYDARFVCRWAIMQGLGCAMLAGLITAVFSSFLLDRLYEGLDILDPSPLDPWFVAAMTGVFYVAAYFLLYTPINTYVERQLKKGRLPESVSGLEDPFMQDAEHTQIQRKIAETFLHLHLHERRNENFGKAVWEYDRLHSTAGIAEHRASLLIEEGRCRRWWTESVPPTIDEMVIRASNEPTPGEVEPVALPIRVRVAALVATISIMYVLVWPFNGDLFIELVSGAGIASVSAVPSVIDMKMSMLGMGIVAMFIVGYIGLREQGFFPLPLFRGECSAEKTRVFHRFRWKTFRPGRDLAILRFTSNQEADIAFLGADGSHATARVGGKYLNHFIACWAAPARATGGEYST